jgi:hypothetical protein
MTALVPRYTIWEGLNVALQAAMRALDEIRTLARLPGPPGRDGFGFDDLEVLYDEERTITLRFMRGQDVREWVFRMPVVIDRGVWQERSYERGDGVTSGGHYWIARCDTSDRPEPNGGAWRLAVKRGRDGKDGGPRVDPPRGPVKVG